MAQQAETPCSPYLLKERRGLREACRQISRAHGAARPPCGTCPLDDLCGQPMLPNWVAKAHQTRALLEDLRGKTPVPPTVNAA